MRSAIHTTFGEPAQVLAAGESPIPQPGAGEVRIKTTLSAIHNHDLWTVRGNYGYRPALPAIGGSEAVGIIDALGEGVEGVSVGQRVATATAHGTWAEYFVTSAATLVPLPDSIPDESAAQLIAMPLSALMLLEFLQVEAGQWIIQNTANGTVGKTLAMLAALRGVGVINLVRRDNAVAELDALGIQHVISTEHPGWQDKAHAANGNAAIQAAVDSVGGRASGDLLRLLGEGGLLVSFGSMTGEPMQISSGDLIFKQASVKGFWGSKVSQALSAEDKRRLLGELITHVASGALALPVAGIFSLEDITDAVTHSLSTGRQGKVLLRP